MPKPTLLMTAPSVPLVLELLEPLFNVHKLWEGDPDVLLEKIATKVVAVQSYALGKVEAGLLDKLPNVEIVAHFGVGYDVVDVATAAKRGIVVTNTPDVLTEEVADTALGLLLMTVRELGAAEKWLRAGHWSKKSDYRLTPMTLRDRRVGIVGLGRIGKAIARRCEAFGLPVSYFGRTAQKGVSNRHYSNLVQMASDVDTLIVVIPGGAATKNIVNAEVLEALGPRGVVINIARGSVVDETALIKALKEKKIKAAGLDVFWNEPNINPELMKLENAVLLPHVGSASIYTRDAMGQLVVDNLKAYLAKKPPLTPVPETPFKGWKKR
ncbi:MAG: 2-hydroxyacid dehydrogenase [Hyphomicrobiaceae bacterium]|nr:MAG: 2-hydroxyacid dehydrogenase [Hyphomicrobiaceae bacterium]